MKILAIKGMYQQEYNWFIVKNKSFLVSLYACVLSGPCCYFRNSKVKRLLQLSATFHAPQKEHLCLFGFF